MSKARVTLEMQKKHLTNEEKIQKEQEEEILTLGKDQLENPPSWLIDDIAIGEFKRIVKENEKVNIIGNLDVNNLGAYCNSYSMYLKATGGLKGKSLVLRKITKNGHITVENPLIKVQKNYAEEMRKFASLCGMTIDSRLKCATAKTTKQQEDIIDEFGDI
ncbi:phage terminase, small subunit, P27 family [Clostridium sporogenes]|uniref:Phage terminase, small subunit, P27 family n=1 Tax=Clostridium sporogenes TaxID=1509 RepID=A0A1L3NG85_CLOSG|nr:phage terminase small subunit P27 family [Clostridium sporogenes]APH15091.1 phage terminase, small subunit, P27 family [Clostridium sporogenes]